MTPVTLDVTNASHIQQAVGQVADLDVLINNAGIGFADDLTDLDVIQKHLDVNLLGLLKVTQGFLPLLARSKGAIVNILSVTSVAPFPVIPAYSISKAAAHNLTQSLRALLTRQRAWCDPRLRRHRYDSWLRYSESVAGVPCGRDLRWPRERRRGHLS